VMTRALDWNNDRINDILIERMTKDGIPKINPRVSFDVLRDQIGYENDSDLRKIEKINRALSRFDLDIQSRDERGNTLLHMYVNVYGSTNISSIVRHLLFLGIDKMVRNKKGNTAYDISVSKMNPELQSMLR